MTAPGHLGPALVIGEALVDIVVHPRQEPVDIPGGTPVSIALGLARLGRDVELHRWIGTDEYGQAVRSHLEASGVRLAPGVDGVARTSMAQATIGKGRATSYVFDLDWNPSRPTLPDGQAPLLVHTGSIATILAPGATTAKQALHETHATSIIVYNLDARPQLVGDPKDTHEIVERLVGLSDLVKCFDEGITRLYDRDADLETVLRSWLDKGMIVVVVTRSKEGAPTLSASGVCLEVLADPNIVMVNTVGAGDPFVGGLGDALWSEDLVGAGWREALRVVDAETLERIIRHTAAIAGITVSWAGANPPTRDELSWGVRREEFVG